MHYYQFNISDYKSHTEHLEPMEDLAYRRMLDWCYLHEKPLPKDKKEIARIVRMRTHTDCIAVVLQEFFAENDSGEFIHKRVFLEIEKANKKSSKARESAKARWDKVSSNANALLTESESNATQDTLPITHYPLPITQDTRHITQDPKPKTQKGNIYIYDSWPSVPDKQILDDWIAMRKRKKANISQTVISRLGKELHKASEQGFTVDDCLEECVLRNWTGFKAEWIKREEKEGVLNQWMKDEISSNIFEGEKIEVKE